MKEEVYPGEKCFFSWFFGGVKVKVMMSYEITKGYGKVDSTR
jgi:hypothetical protein